MRSALVSIWRMRSRVTEKRRAHLLERVLAVLADAEAQAQDLLLLGRQRARAPAPPECVRSWVIRLSLGDSAPLSSRKSPSSESSPIGRLERERLARGLQDQPYLARGHAGALGQLLRRGLAAHLVDQGAVHPRDAVERLHHVHRDADGARVVGDGPRDGLPDPPRRVGRELEPAPVLEAVHRLHEADVALLDQVQERQLAAEVALGHRDHQPQVGLHQLALGLPHHAVVLLDLAERRRAGPCGPSPTSSSSWRGARRGSWPPRACPWPAADLGDELVDQRGLERELLEHASGSTRGSARSTCGSWRAWSCSAACRRARPAAARSRARAGGCARRRPGSSWISLGRGLATLGQQDHVVERRAPRGAPVHQGQQLARGERECRPRARRSCDLADLDPLAEADLFRGLQQARPCRSP